jgi:CRP-like cAMP-binding protein
LTFKETLFATGQEIEQVYFIEHGLVSLLAQTDQARIEVGMIGREGIAGVTTFLSKGPSSLTAIVQGGGEALRMSAEEYRHVTRAQPALLDATLRYINFMLTQTAQTAYANANYGVEARLARWILMTHDRLQQDELPMTHDFMSMMLGTRRSTVTTATHVLEANQLIKAERGVITVRNRSKLEELAGDSYGPAEAEYRQLFGTPQ